MSSENVKYDYVQTAILQEFPDGTRMVEVPNTSGKPTIADGHDFVAILDAEGIISRLMMNFDIAKVRRYLEWMVKHGVMHREATDKEIDAIVKGVASRMHFLIDKFNAEVSKAVLYAIGADLPENPNDDHSGLDAILQSICFDKLCRSARESGLRRKDELEVHKKIRNLLLDRVTSESLDLPTGLESDDVREYLSAEEQAAKVREICNQILSEVMPACDTAGSLFNFIEDLVESYVSPEGSGFDEETKSKCLDEIEKVVYSGVESKDSALGDKIMAVLVKYGIGEGIEGMDIDIKDID